MNSVKDSPRSVETKNRLSSGVSFSHPQSAQHLAGPSVGLNGIEYVLVYVGLLVGE
jgi:hypothetical protein